jgi:predicted SAM-dependent methyltransferase
MSIQGICLNIGSGLDAPEQWLNIDSSPTLTFSKIPLIGRPILSMLNGPQWPKAVKSGDLIRGLSLTENSCELIFASHVLEHLSVSDCQTALKNIFYYLKPEGTFRVIVPDLEALIADYQTSQPSSEAAWDFMDASGIGCKASRSTFRKRLAEAISNSRHQWMWDESSLKGVLAKQGFKNIRRCQYGEWSDSRFSLVEKEGRHIKAVCLEASK